MSHLDTLLASWPTAQPGEREETVQDIRSHTLTCVQICDAAQSVVYKSVTSLTLQSVHECQDDHVSRTFRPTKTLSRFR